MERFFDMADASATVVDVDGAVDLEMMEKWEEGLHKGSLRREVHNNGLISDLFDKQILTYLEKVFAQSESGNQALTTTEFRDLMARFIPLNLVDSIYRSIDVNDVGYIKYSDFTNYLIASEEGSAFSSKTYATRLVLNFTQEDDNTTVHKDMIDCMVYVKKPCAMVITGGRDGQLSLWNAESLDLITHIAHRDKNAVYEEELHRGMDKILKAKCAKMSTTTNKHKNTKVAITSICPLLNTGLLCVGSADGCVTIYDIGTQDICGRYTDLEFIPTAIECFHRKQSFHFADASSVVAQDLDLPIPHIAIGDSAGQVSIIKLHVEFGLSTEVGMKKKNQLLFAQSVAENCTKLKVLTHWITQMRFVPETDALIASSTNGIVYFLDVARGCVIREFTGHLGTKIGVRTFSWSAFGKYIVSGADRSILFWDLFTLESVYKIEALKSPVVQVDVQDELNKLVAILVNKTIHVWHNITYELLQTVMDTTVYKPLNSLTAVVCSPDLKMLFTAGNRVTAWTLERSSEGVDVNDTYEDLCCVLYNNMLNQVVMVKSLGMVKVYQSETGEIVRQFSVLPINPNTGAQMVLKADKLTEQFPPVIKTACFDKVQSRLIVTGHDLSVQFWNINDGTPLIQVEPQLYSTTLAHIYANLPKSVSSLSYEVLFIGAHKRARKLLLIGTEQGNLCGFQENTSVIEECPVFFLRLTDFAPMEHVVKHTSDEHGLQRGRLNSLVTGMVQNKRANSLAVGSYAEAEDARHAIHAAKKSGPGHNNPGHHHHYNNNRYNEASHGHAHEDGQGAGEHANVGGAAMDPLHHNADSTVLWMELIEGSCVLMVGYLSGLVALWDLEKLTRLHDLPLHQFGPILVGMRTKDYYKQHHAKQAAQLSRFKRPLFADLAFSATITGPNADSASGRAAAGGGHGLGRKNSSNNNSAAALPQSMSKTLLVNKTSDSVPTPPQGSPKVPRAEKSPKPAGRKSQVSPTATGGRVSKSNSMDEDDPSDNDVRVAELTSTLPKLHFSKGDATSAPKLLTGSRTRKSSILKVSAQRISAIRRASTMMVRNMQNAAAHSPDGHQSRERDIARTISIGSSDDEGDAAQGVEPHHHANHAHNTHAAGHVSHGVSGHLAQSGGLAEQSTVSDLHPGESGSLTDNFDNSLVGNFMPNQPAGVGPKGGFNRRDSAAMALLGASGDLLNKMRKSIVGGHGAPGVGSAGSGPPNAHRRLSVALNPQKQYGQISAADAQHHSLSLSRPHGVGTGSVASATGTMASIFNSSAVNKSAQRQPGRQHDRQDLYQSSVESLQSASNTMQSSTVSIDSSDQLTSQSISAAGRGTFHSHSLVEEPAAVVPKIVVDAVVILPRSQVVIGACSDKYIRFWDLETHHILCACLYYHIPEPTDAETSSTKDTANAPPLGANPSAPQAGAPAGSNALVQPQGAGHRHHHHHRKHHGQTAPSQAAAHNVPVDEVLRHLKVSDSEDLLIGAYDTGMIRTWSIQSFSLVSLKGLLMKYLTTSAAAAERDELDATEAGNNGTGTHPGRRDSNLHHTTTHNRSVNSETDSKGGDPNNPFVSGAYNFGFGAMAISPITLLHEWHAHKSPMISIEYIWFEYEAIGAELGGWTEPPTDNNSRAVTATSKSSNTATAASPSRRTGSASGASVSANAGFGAGVSSKMGLTIDTSSQSGKLSTSDSRKISPRRAQQLASQAAQAAQDALNAQNASSCANKQSTTMKDHLDVPRASFHNAKSGNNLDLWQQSKRIKREKNSDMGMDILEGFIMSAGLDQKVYLWNLSGRCVGEFGTYGWDINNEATWYKGNVEKMKKSSRNAKKSHQATDPADRAAIDTAASSITKETVNLVRSPSTILIQNIGRHRHHSSQELNDYVDALSRKISTKPPVYVDEDSHFSNIMTKHPMVDAKLLKPPKKKQ